MQYLVGKKLIKNKNFVKFYLLPKISAVILWFLVVGIFPKLKLLTSFILQLNKKPEFLKDSADSDQQHQPSTPNRLSLAGMKRKYSAQQEYSSNSSSSNSNSPCRLPQFVGCPLPSDLAPLKAMTAEQHNPSPSNSAEFITPSQPKKVGERNNSEWYKIFFIFQQIFLLIKIVW